jgi:hypothetical protein
MTDIHCEHRHLTVACELETAGDMRARAAEWQRLRDQAGTGAGPIPGGVRLWLRPAFWDTARDLVGKEAACCGFLDFDMAVEDDRVRLDITSPAPEAQPIIAMLTGIYGDRVAGDIADHCVTPCC